MMKGQWMKRSPTLRAMQREELRILEHVQLAAAEANAEYYLAYGTALGSVRHQEHIPWDWDMDLLVPIEHYEALVGALKRLLPADLEVSEPGSGDSYSPMFARVNSRALGHAFMHVDLFPLTGAPGAKSVQRVHARLNRFIRRLHSFKLLRQEDRTHYSRAQRIVVRSAKAVLWPIPARVIRSWFHRLNRRPTDSQSGWVCSPAGPYGVREYFRLDVFSPQGVGRFGELSGVPLPGNSSAYLTQLYGASYMTPLPEAAQSAAFAFFSTHIEPRVRAYL